MKSRVSVYCVAMALLMVFAAVGCSKAPSDAQVTSQIQSKMGADSGLQGKQIAVQASAGSVTLSGTVDNDAERDAAARYAASVPGVKQVINNIQVAPMSADQNTPDQTAQNQPPAPAAQDQSRPSPSYRASRRHRSDADSTADSNANSQPAAEDASANPPADNPPPDNSASTQPAPAVAPPPAPVELTVPSGTAVSVRLIDPLNSETAQQGQTFRASLNAPLSVNGEVAIPAGYTVQGHVVEVQSAGKFTGKSLLTLQLDKLTVNGKHYTLQTDQFHQETSGRGKKTAEKVGIGSALGGIIGAIAGGGKGAAIGAAVGAGAGGGVQAASKGSEVNLPSETVLNFTLQSPVTVTQTTQGPHSGGQQLQVNN